MSLTDCLMRKTMRKQTWIWLAAIMALCLLSTACTTQKKLSYFNRITAESADTINPHFSQMPSTRIKAGDALVITVNGLDAEAVLPFNLPVVAHSAPGSAQLATTQTQQSYLVDINGNITFPILGTLHLAGLTKEEAIEYLQKSLEPHLKSPVVTIKFINYTVTVMGEVNRPGKYTINNERATLLDVLGMAGDLTPYGKRNNILITRENNGKLEFTRINLNSDELFRSPYYFLQQNDVIYVEPNSVRAMSSQNISLYLSMITTLGSLATVIVTVLNNQPR